MKTLGCVVIMLFAFAVPVRAAQVYSGCTVPSATPRHVWYVDPVHGKTPAAGGNGSQASPWNSLSGIISGSWARQLLGSGLHAPAAVERSLRPYRQWQAASTLQTRSATRQFSPATRSIS